METDQRDPTQLAHLQRWLRWIITEPKGVAATLSEPNTREPHPRLLLAVRDAPPLAREERLNIYAEAYFLRLVEALSKDYEVLSELLDEDSFRKLVADYLEAHPSFSPNIGDVGHLFPGFLKTHSFISDIPYLSDLANLEWAVIKAFYADDLPPLELSDLSAIVPEQWPSAKMRLDSSVQLLKASWPVDLLWHEHRSSKELSSDLSAEPCDFLVYREGFVPRVERIHSTQRLLLEAFSNGEALGTCFESISELPEAESLPVLFQSWFQSWVKTGIIRKIEVSK